MKLYVPPAAVIKKKNACHAVKRWEKEKSATAQKDVKIS